ncbi:pore-forming ESAT-6 family protein [Actinomadura graeca]|uniref:Pore-forming ESAT-6 family protein n=1 Tax=Actinomadura graeca TaxID=2750812 RepID=A0ABX8QZI1_9ACTN|nr:pore-forming ESAT-6 family protein [Actinomadura graeca]QXJ24195.1 pore-forming ESAT-6 family protein [Actinomadura graeca]
MGANGRRSYDTGASGEAQANIQAIVSRLEALIGTRDTDVKTALADFQATGVDEEYRAKEIKWHTAANEVREIIRLVKATLESNDEHAQTALGKAGAAVQAI